MEKKMNFEFFEKLDIEFLNDDYLIEPEHYNIRIDNHGRRFYARVYAEKEKVYIRTAPSVTTILAELKPGFGLMEFYKKNDVEKIKFISHYSALYGTIFHILAGKLLKGEKISCSKGKVYELMQEHCTGQMEQSERLFEYMREAKRDIIKDLFAFQQWIKDFDVKPIAIEYPVMTKNYAGTVDLVAEISVKKKFKKEELIEIALQKTKHKKTHLNKMKKEELEIILKLNKQERKLVLIDLKSGLNGFFRPHIMQLHAYRKAWDEEHSDLKIDYIYNWGCKNYRYPAVKYNFTDQSDNPVIFAEFNAFVKYYYCDPDRSKIRPVYAINEDKTFNEDEHDKLIELVDPVEELREYYAMEVF
jgi:hypothetical protein